jgi:alkylhydroperoxidase family enzyme
MDEAMVARIADVHDPQLPEAVRIALEFVEAWVLDHAQTIDGALIERLRGHYSDSQIVELAVAAGTFEAAHKFMLAFDIGPEAEGIQITERGGVPAEFRRALGLGADVPR